MPIRSKWEFLPTEAINAATLAIDKLPAADVVELMMNEDRRVVAAVQRAADRQPYQHSGQNQWAELTGSASKHEASRIPTTQRRCNALLS